MQRGNWIAIRSSETSSVRSRTTLAAGFVLGILYFVHLLVLGTCSNVAPKYQVALFPIKISSLLSPSGDLGIGLVTGQPHFGPTVEILFKLN